MVLKQTITRNIQNHKEVVIDYPPTGLIVFTGNNSNGKSVIVKVTKAIVTGTIKRPRKRANLLNRNEQSGEAIWIRDDDVTLKLHLTREAATTYVSYTEPGKEPIVRYLSDKSYQDLVYKFGWHYDANSGISLNISEADEALLFYKTSSRNNSTIIETAASDLAANAAIEKFTQVIHDARGLRDQYNIQIRQYESSLRELSVEDTEPLLLMRDALSKAYSCLSKFYFPDLPEVVPVPKVRTINIYMPALPTMKYPVIMDVSCNLPDITPIWKEIEALKNHKCPTCGRGFDVHESTASCCN